MTRVRRAREEPADQDLGPSADPESIARAIVLRKLTARAQSRHELARTLAAKDVPLDVATAVLDRFEQVGLIDDQAFADSWVESRRNSRGLAVPALARELRAKGLADHVVQAAVERVSADDERNSARLLVDRKLRSMRNLDDAARYRRLAGLLARKGYSGELTRSVVRQALAEHGASLIDDASSADVNALAD